MRRDKYHGILLDLAFLNPKYPENYKIFNCIQSGNWNLIGIEIDYDKIDNVISEIQLNMNEDQPFYVHFYNDEDLIVVFKEKRFNVSNHESSWKEIIEYGKTKGIPEKQLDFWPNRYQDEIHYFKK